MHGGDQIAGVLLAHNVKFVFTLCGGHISPILVGCKQLGIRILDVRHEATAVFAADAVARLSGVPGVAVVTAGPGLTNTITAVKNAQMAQSPIVLIGGATATALKGRGSLQDIDQMALLRPHVKWATTVKRVRYLAAVTQKAFAVARRGVPGPVFIECPVDLLYPESLVREWYGIDSGGQAVGDKLIKLYLARHVNRLFSGGSATTPQPADATTPVAGSSKTGKVSRMLESAKKPVLLVGSQAMLQAEESNRIAAAVDKLGLPTFLSGMARGLLGRSSAIQLRHKRRQALREADLVILAGVPSDFRLNYGRHIGRGTKLISINRSSTDLKKNRKPNLGVLSDPGAFLVELAKSTEIGLRDPSWLAALKERDTKRDAEIISQSEAETQFLNPLALCRELENHLPDDAVLVADGGDFVATASYILRPRAPLSWLDPGVFGTLGVGAGFALGAKLCRPEAQVWAIFGDGSVGYSLTEFDTFVRHKIPVIAVVGNDAGWTQIAREQVEVLKDDVATVLANSDYHRVAEAFGARGFVLDAHDQIANILQQAESAEAQAKPVLINARIGKTEFRKGSISI